MNAPRPWTPEDDSNLIRMRSVEQKTWVAIGNALGGRSKTACQLRYTTIVPQSEQVTLAGRRTWLPADEAQLCKLRRDEHKSCKEIAAIFGVSPATIVSKLDRMNRPVKRIQIEQSSGKLIIPQRCLEDRDRRYAASPRDLTSAFFGDPLPGFSALERRV